MVFVFTCTMMIHGDLGPDKFKSASLLVYVLQIRTINNQTEVVDQRWQVTHRT